MLEGVVTVEVQLLGTFLFLPSKVVSISLTERREEDKQSHINGVANMTKKIMFIQKKNLFATAILPKNPGIERLERTSSPFPADTFPWLVFSSVLTVKFVLKIVRACASACFSLFYGLLANRFIVFDGIFSNSFPFTMQARKTITLLNLCRV